MSVAFYIVPEREIEGFDCFVNGKAVAHASEKKLAKICQSLGVKPLTSFYSQDPEELAALLEGEGLEAGGYPDQEWFEAEEGVTTVAALIGYLRTNPEKLSDAEAVLDDLEQYKRVLERLASERVRWYLALDF